ncbi:MAG: DNA polymerase III subunit [Clostridia bacterium]|nr:DNA polymerase III subunit [Clostridia bacterium]
MDFFPALIENADTKKRLARAILENSFPHAFIIEGPKGCGKHTLATQLSAALNCENRTGAASFPCGYCSNCARILKKNFVDVHYLSRKEGKSTIGVEEIRSLREDIYLSPTESRYKIYVIEEAQTMTPQAQNALLKIFEEPPSGVIIFLLCDNMQKILSTIKSRAQLVRMQRLTDDVIREALRSDPDFSFIERTDPGAFTSAIQLSQGSIGRSKEFLAEDQLTAISESRRTAMTLISLLVPSKNRYSLYAAIQSLPQKRNEFTPVARMILDGLRDLILSKYESNTPLLFFTDKKEVENLAIKIGHARLLRFYDAFISSIDKSEKNGNMNAILANLCVIASKV